LKLYRDISLIAQAPTLAVLLGQKLVSRSGHYETINDFVKRFFPPVLDDGHVVRGHSFLVGSLHRHKIPRPQRIYEQGTGWHGSDVLAFYLLGADRIQTVDTSAWLRLPNLRHTARQILLQKHVLRPIYQRYLGSDIGTFDERVGELERTKGDPSRLFERGLIEYVVTKDIGLIPEGFADYDLVFSNSVLQRIPLTELKLFLQATKTSRAIHLHRIDCSDFQAMRNKRIHKLSYLLVDEEMWNRWTSKYLSYQNRLRAFEFVDLFKEYGYTAELADEYLTSESVAFARDHFTIVKEKYGERDLHDIAITNFSLIAKP
jgi:hypothetical protein